MFDKIDRRVTTIVLETPCEVWTGYLDRYGYARGGGQLIYRKRYEEQVGPVPLGMELDHLCRNRACVNVAHLEPVTHAENVRRGHGADRLRSRTHCPQGHPYDEANTYYSKKAARSSTRRATTERHCRTCNRQAVARYRARGTGR